jgi:hypothetical protein
MATIAWTVGSLVAWFTSVNLVGLFLFEYLANRRNVNLPERSGDVFSWIGIAGFIAGFVLIPPIVALLAMRAYLPGTGTRRSKLRGFPIDEPPRG